VVDAVRAFLGQTPDPDANLFDIRCQQGHGGQSGRADGKAFAGCSGGVAQSVQRVGPFADFRIEAGHFRVAAGVVGDRPVGVGGQGDAQRREHADGSEADAVQTHRHVGEAAGETIRAQDADHDRDDRQARRVHAVGETVDDGRRRPHSRLIRDAFGRLVLIGGVVFGELPNQHAGDQTGNHRAEDAPTDPVRHRQTGEHDQNQHGTAERSEQQGAKQILLAGVFLAADHEHADDRQQNTDACDDHGGQDGLQRVHAAGGNGRQRQGGAEGGGRQDRAAVALVQVGAHAGDIADVVADVVGDGGRIARVVFRNAGFDLADQVSADVRGLRVDTATDAGEEGLRRGAHAEGDHRRRDFHEHPLRVHARVNEGQAPQGQTVLHVFGRVDELVEDQVPQRDVEQTEAHHDQAHDGAGPEGHLQTAVEAFAGALGGARGGGRCRLHPQKSAQAAEEAAGEEGHGDEWVLDAFVRQKGEERHENRENHGDHTVLTSEVGIGAFTHVLGDLDHLLRARRSFDHLLVEVERKPQSAQRRNGRNPPEQRRTRCRLGIDGPPGGLGGAGRRTEGQDRHRQPHNSLQRTHF